jgi:hypothetical protein
MIEERGWKGQIVPIGHLADFSEKETTLFIQGVPLDQLPKEMVIKIKSLEINKIYRLLGRYLSMIFEQE